MRISRQSDFEGGHRPCSTERCDCIDERRRLVSVTQLFLCLRHSVSGCSMFPHLLRLGLEKCSEKRRRGNPGGVEGRNLLLNTLPLFSTPVTSSCFGGRPLVQAAWSDTPCSRPSAVFSSRARVAVLMPRCVRGCKPQLVLWLPWRPSGVGSEGNVA